MKKIEISAIPNQSFSVQLGVSRYDITLKETRGVMCASLSRDSIVILQNQRLVAGQPLIPYFYKEDGNFVLLTENDDLPDYTQFGVSQSLYFATAAELLTLRA